MRFFAVPVYVISMDLSTVIMANGFAAFPAMTRVVGVPILVGVHHGNPAVMAAVRSISGYCSTSSTPLAANFYILPTALAVLLCNVFLLFFLMPRSPATRQIQRGLWVISPSTLQRP